MEMIKFNKIGSCFACGDVLGIKVIECLGCGSTVEYKVPALPGPMAWIAEDWCIFLHQFVNLKGCIGDVANHFGIKKDAVTTKIACTIDAMKEANATRQSAAKTLDIKGFMHLPVAQLCVCQNPIAIKKLICIACGSEYALQIPMLPHPFAFITLEDFCFIYDFLGQRGNVSALTKQYKISRIQLDARVLKIASILDEAMKVSHLATSLLRAKLVKQGK